MRKPLCALLFAAALSGLWGCQSSSSMPSGRQLTAKATLGPLNGDYANGTVIFSQNGNGSVHVEADLNKLRPGKHGLHVHAGSLCGVTGEEAQGHFNPSNHTHGAPGSASHEGDLGNIMADSEGNAHLSLNVDFLHLSGPETIIGHALVLHSDEDDLHSQPSGNSGSRIACAVIVDTTQR